MKTKKEPIKHKYIFPNILADVMSKVDMRTQFEASMLSMAFMMLGMLLSAVYFIIYIDLALWFKIALGINAVFGMMFMGSYLTTTYQQYLTHMETLEWVKETKNTPQTKPGSCASIVLNEQAGETGRVVNIANGNNSVPASLGKDKTAETKTPTELFEDKLKGNEVKDE